MVGGGGFVGFFLAFILPRSRVVIVDFNLLRGVFHNFHLFGYSL